MCNNWMIHLCDNWHNLMCNYFVVVCITPTRFVTIECYLYFICQGLTCRLPIWCITYVRTELLTCYSFEVFQTKLLCFLYNQIIKVNKYCYKRSLIDVVILFQMLNSVQWVRHQQDDQHKSVNKWTHWPVVTEVVLVCCRSYHGDITDIPV